MTNFFLNIVFKRRKLPPAFNIKGKVKASAPAAGDAVRVLVQHSEGRSVFTIISLVILFLADLYLSLFHSGIQCTLTAVDLGLKLITPGGSQVT